MVSAGLGSTPSRAWPDEVAKARTAVVSGPRTTRSTAPVRMMIPFLLVVFEVV
ncbi:MAG: hypothetical protein ACKOYJ_02315 [Planctomycetia bacterium]